jgi:ABC-type branched-subunit amino acid transport system substrate-binding protein
VFGTAGKICEPGNAAGGIGRGVTKSEIQIGTFTDAGSALSPGLNKEYWEAADGFVKWCNAAGGINGRKIKLIKRDAKAFGAGPAMVKACESDFMLVGGGQVFDQEGVKPRLKCKLGNVAAYLISQQAIDAPLQVTPDIPGGGKIKAGLYRLLAQKYPEAVKHWGYGTGNIQSLLSLVAQQKQAAEANGWKAVDFQVTPIQVDNWRPYITQSEKAGVQVLTPTAAGGPAYIQAMHDVGWMPKLMALGYQDYVPSVIASAKAVQFPPTYLGVTTWPLELADQNPPTVQAIDMIKAADPKAKVVNLHMTGMSTWVLWAKAASACGNNLTTKCVLDKAKAHTDWTGGGLTAPVDLSTRSPSDCVAIMKVTPDGFVLQKDLTQPNYRGVFNCDKRNVAIVKVKK